MAKEFKVGDEVFWICNDLDPIGRAVKDIVNETSTASGNILWGYYVGKFNEYVDKADVFDSKANAIKEILIRAARTAKKHINIYWKIINASEALKKKHGLQ